MLLSRSKTEVCFYAFLKMSVNNFIGPIFLGDYKEHTAHTWSTPLGARAIDQVRIFFGSDPIWPTGGHFESENVTFRYLNA